MPITLFDVKGIPLNSASASKRSVVTGGEHVSVPHEAFISADPFGAGVKVLITVHGLEGTVTFTLDEDPVLIAGRAREALDP